MTRTDEFPRELHVSSISRRGFHRIAYVEWGDRDSKKVVVCVHGLTRQGRDFDPLAKALASRGYRVVCPDLVGRGRSGWLADADEYALPQYTMDMTVLLARLDVEEVSWVGTSLGGLIGMVLAGNDRTPIRTLIINDIGPALPWLALNRIGKYLEASPRTFASVEAAVGYFRDVLAPFGQLSDAEWLHLTIHSIARGEDGLYRQLVDPGIARAFRTGLSYNLSLWRYWDAIRCPTLVLRGETSDLLLPEIAKDMHQRGPKAQVVEIRGCGHAPPLLNVEQIDLVVRWLQAADDRRQLPLNPP